MQISTNLKINEILSIKSGPDLEEAFKTYSNFCIENNFDFSITRVNSYQKDLISFLQKNNFYNIETTYEISCRASKIKNIQINNKKVSKQCDIEELCSLSSGMFNHGRFVEDPNLGKKLSDKRYYNFTKDLYNSDNDRLFMFSKDKIIGFMFYKTTGQKTNLILGGMQPKFSHLAKFFWSRVFSELPEQNIISTVISGSNIGVMNLYSHFGFSFNNAKSGYHKKWRKNES